MATKAYWPRLTCPPQPVRMTREITTMPSMKTRLPRLVWLGDITNG